MKRKRDMNADGHIACGACGACARVIIAMKAKVRCQCGLSTLWIHDGKIQKSGRVVGERWV